jgi:endo-alpha-1,4-polygalactosaminidase (GH114 family)
MEGGNGMEVKVELLDYFDKIEGEDITGYYAYVVDENQAKWKYSYHRQPRQSIPQFIQEVQDAFRHQKEDDFRYDGKA